MKTLYEAPETWVNTFSIDPQEVSGGYTPGDNETPWDQ